MAPPSSGRPGILSARLQLQRPSTHPQLSSTEKQRRVSQVVITSAARAVVTQTSPEQPALAQSASVRHSPSFSRPSTRSRQAP